MDLQEVPVMSGIELDMKDYYWKDGLRLAAMFCRAREVFLFDQDDMAEFWTEHAAHNIMGLQGTLRV